MFILRIYQIITGYLILSVEGAFLERFINLCTRKGIPLWNIRRLSETEISVSMSIKSFRRIRDIARKSNVKISIMRKKGLPFIVYRYRARYGIVVGMIAFAMLLWGMSGFIWSIEVDGNSALSSETITSVLYDYGFKTGILKASVNLDKIQNDVLLNVRELVWISINIKGTKALVEVKERVQKPEIVPKDQPCNIIANSSGYVEYIETLSGETQVKVGDSVLKGDILVSGIIDSRTEGVRIVHSQAVVKARTVRCLTATQPFNHTEKTETGKTKSKKRLNILGFHINLYFNSSIPYDNYDIIHNRKDVTLFGLTLPLFITEERFSELTVTGRYLSLEEAEKMALADIEKQEETLKECTILSKEQKGSIIDNGYVLEVKYECLEDIAQADPIDMESISLNSNK